jgi:diaminohydroxyphosphoribosylaminopyrimidine deaminase / 5-amino-6-(5-phosphoribosylamino)uracil reductase
MSILNDKRFMIEALHLAAKGDRAVSPNPMVGAVLVKGGKILARGYHRVFGGAHAEVDCLSRYRGPLQGTTMYVTLEPCSHYGKTPPCAQLLAYTPIARIVIAMQDPNPLVAGKGITLLRKAGKKVDVGVLAEEAADLNRRFIRAVTHHRPYIHVKVAQTLDGRITLGEAKDRWVTGPEARQVVHAMRTDHDAVLVGAGTVLADDPRLTVRGMSGNDPHVVVLDGELRMRASARLIRAVKKRTVFVMTTTRAMREKPARAAELARAGVQVLGVDGKRGRFALTDVLGVLYDEGIGSLLVEGGGDVFGQFASAGVIDELSIFVAPRLAPSGVPAFGSGATPGLLRAAAYMHTHDMGRDIWIHALFD